MARQTERGTRNIIRVALISGLILLVFFITYLWMTRSFQIRDAESNVREVALQMSRNTARTFERSLANLRLNAAALATQEKTAPYSDKSYLPELQAITLLEGYYSSFLIDEDGRALDDSGEAFWAADRLGAGQYNVPEEIILPPGEAQGRQVLTFLVPIYQNGRIVGTLGAGGLVSQYSQVPVYLDNWGEYFVVDSGGQVLMRDPAHADVSESHTLPHLDDLGFWGDGHQSLADSLANWSGGDRWGTDPDGACYFAWEPVAETDGWFLLLRVPARAVTAQAQVVTVILACLCVLFLAVFVFSFYYLKRLRAETGRELLLEQRLYATLTEALSGLLMVSELPGQQTHFYRTQANGELFDILFHGVKPGDHWLSKLTAFLDAHVPSPGHFEISPEAEGTGTTTFWYTSPLDGNAYMIRANYVNLRDESGRPERLVIHFEDISDQASREQELLNRARVDGMTGVLNKKTFEKQVAGFLDSRPRGRHALILIDLDHFKTVNDNCGHAFADTLLVQVADDLRTVFEEGDMVGRIGGDEFAACKRYFADRASLSRELEKLVTTVYRRDEGGRYQISVSCGVACYPEDGLTLEALTEKADKALYAAKAAGRNRARIYQPDDDG